MSYNKAISAGSVKKVSQIRLQPSVMESSQPYLDLELFCVDEVTRTNPIFRFVYELAGCKKPFKRLWISSMEESAIREGFAALKDGREYDRLYHSALCRAKADWIIGINAPACSAFFMAKP